MLDAHTHILPKMDDGSKSSRRSAAMLRREARQGVDRVILTSHFYAEQESLDRFLRRRAKSAERLETVLAEVKDLPERILGAEVTYFNGMSRTDGIEQLCIGGTQAMLIEMPFGRWSRSVLDELEYLMDYRYIRPVIAHVERYLPFQPLGTVRRLCEDGVWMQANASFFLNRRTAWLAARMLKRRHIHFIGSDCHDLKRRPPNVEDAMAEIDWRLGDSAMRHLQRMERRLLEGK